MEAQEPKQRLQKILSEAGISSRREAERMIKDGEVTINGKIAKVGDKALLSKDHIKVRGKLLRILPKKVVIAFFKPRDVMTTPPPAGFDSEKIRGTIWEYLEKVREKVTPVGRLDTDTEGLLLLTNDGDLGDRLNKSKYEVAKVYTVKVDGHVEEKKLKRLRFGVPVEGEKIKVNEIEAARGSEGKQWLRVTLTDPRNRLIRKLFESVGHPVDKVRRDAFCSIGLRGLARGEWRYLADHEVLHLRKFVGLAKPS